MTSLSPSPPLVDVIIPVHTTQRPLERALASLRKAGLPSWTDGEIRVSIVCHNISANEIRETLSPTSQRQVRLLEFRDDTKSPAGPRNLGLSASAARYVSFLDSDDSLDPGALAYWVEVAEKNGSAFVLPRISLSGGGSLRSPLPRCGRRSALNPVKDRLFYRTVTFGLLRKEFANNLGLTFDPSLVTGEDLEFTLRIYFSGARVDLAHKRPGYVLWDDVDDRVRTTARPVRDDLRACVSIPAAPWFRSLGEEQSCAVVVKLLRVHVLGAVGTRADLGPWSPADRHELARAAASLLECSPGARRSLSRAEDRLLSVVLDPSAPDALLSNRYARQRRHGHWDTLIASTPSHTLSRDAPARILLAKTLVR